MSTPSPTRLRTHSPPPPPHVAIIGGGLAGLAAAASLVGRGLKITVFESRPRLGGRASSFTDPMTGEQVDNCQHVSMVCCTNLAAFCRRVGVADLFRREPEVVFLSPEGTVSRLRAGWLPAPFHLAGSFLSATYLNARDKVRVAYGLARLCSTRGDRPGEPFALWLGRHGQTPRTLDRYWSPVLVSALNERLEQMDVGHARKVFLDGFLRHRDGFQMEIPLVPLGDLYGRRLESWFAEHDVDVRLAAGAREVVVDSEASGTVNGLILRSGETVHADFVLISTPFGRVGPLLPESVAERVPEIQRLAELRASPITGVHLWFDQEVCPFDHVVTIGRTIQWIFNHTAIQGRRPGEAENGQYLQLVISASYDLLSLDNTAIRDLVLQELREIFPVARSASLLRWWVVTEHGATFAVRPGVDALRPGQRTPVDGLFFAGDWTATGWPATMEGAVRSGFLAAEGILQDLGRPESLIAPDLSPGFLARWLIPRSRQELPQPPSLNRATDRVTPRF